MKLTPDIRMSRRESIAEAITAMEPLMIAMISLRTARQNAPQMEKVAALNLGFDDKSIVTLNYRTVVVPLVVLVVLKVVKILYTILVICGI